MTASDSGASAPGLRERKKQRTRESIARVALELFAQRGYDETTLDDIAEAADISKRTIFSYYQSKEDILFSEEPALLSAVELALRNRPPGTTTVEALRGLLGAAAPTERGMLRKRIIGSNAALRLSERARYARAEELLAEAIAQDLDAGPDDIRPLLIAASVAAAFNTAYDRILTQAAGEGPQSDACVLFDRVLDLLRSGLEALQQR